MNPVKKILRKVPGIGLAREAATLLRGVREFSRTGETSEEAYQSLIRLYCRTRGWSNDALHWGFRATQLPYILPPASGILGHFGPGEVLMIADHLREKGYYIFPKLLATDLVARLKEYALRTPAAPSPAPANGPKLAEYDAVRPLAPLYRFRESDLIENPDVQAFFCDPSVLAIAQAYLGCAPILDSVAMWWSAPFGERPSVEGAQLYHFDMDRVKWLKFFIYLTDVTPDTGAHRFIAGSHRTGAQPSQFLKQGYARLTDDEVKTHYSEEAHIEFTGPAGTIFAEDTRGLHKGQPPRSGHRLAFELEYADSLFGKPIPTIAWKEARPELVAMNRRFPRIFTRYSNV